MLRSAIVSIIIMALMGQTMSKGLLVWDYYQHRQSYLERCINKNKPALHCNGKCQLEKKADSAEDTNHRGWLKIGLSFDLIDSSCTAASLIPEFLTDARALLCQVPRSLGSVCERARFCFHPPD